MRYSSIHGACSHLGSAERLVKQYEELIAIPRHVRATGYKSAVAYGYTPVMSSETCAVCWPCLMQTPLGIFCASLPSLPLVVPHDLLCMQDKHSLSEEDHLCSQEQSTGALPPQCAQESTKGIGGRTCDGHA